MSKSAIPNIPGINAVTDTFDFVKNMWGGMNIPGMNIPGMVMPTLSVDEINKQIKDLKAVESWLTLNMNMLHGTIQALEVQSATLSTLQSMSESFTSAMTPPKAKQEPSDKPAFESPFSFSKAPANSPADKPAPAVKPAEPAKPVVAEEALAAELANAAPPLANPAAWWNMLQDQFKQAVNTAAAMTPEMPAAAAAPVGKAAPARKKAASAAATGKRKAPPKA